MENYKPLGLVYAMNDYTCNDNTYKSNINKAELGKIDINKNDNNLKSQLPNNEYYGGAK